MAKIEGSMAVLVHKNNGTGHPSGMGLTFATALTACLWMAAPSAVRSGTETSALAVGPFRKALFPGEGAS